MIETITINQKKWNDLHVNESCSFILIFMDYCIKNNLCKKTIENGKDFYIFPFQNIINEIPLVKYILKGFADINNCMIELQECGLVTEIQNRYKFDNENMYHINKISYEGYISWRNSK